MAPIIDIMGPGSIVMGATMGRQNLIEVPLSAAQAGGRWLTHGNSIDRQPTFSPDGKWVLFSSNRSDNLDLWKVSTESGAVRRITEDPADDWDPAFTPDGERILWSSSRTGHLEIWMCNADGTGARQLTDDGVDAENPTATPDGRWIVYNSTNPKAPGIWKIHPDGTGAVRIVPGIWSTPDVSPDGVHVAFRTGVSEPRTLMVARLEDGEMVGQPIVLPGNIFTGRPRWMPDGRALLFTGLDDAGHLGVFAQDFAPEKDTTTTRRPLVAFEADAPAESFAISPNGSRVILAPFEEINSLMLADGLTGLESK
jgi:Tol biopolymer transport system component